MLERFKCGRSDDALRRILSPLPGLIGLETPFFPGLTPGANIYRAYGASTGYRFLKSL